MSFLPGARLEHFEIIGRLGAGGRGVAYRARGTRDSREVQVCPATGELFCVCDRELGDLCALTGLDLG